MRIIIGLRYETIFCFCICSCCSTRRAVEFPFSDSTSPDSIAHLHRFAASDSSIACSRSKVAVFINAVLTVRSPSSMLMKVYCGSPTRKNRPVTSSSTRKCTESPLCRIVNRKLSLSLSRAWLNSNVCSFNISSKSEWEVGSRNEK